ncbi:MAG: TonB-dependent receptor [Bacteroidales bacterium]|nr:TonB-dependent receptor [Bacteroidales bacterium]
MSFYKKQTGQKLGVLMLLILVLIGNVFSIPQVNHGEISGIVKDSLSGEGLPFATVQLLAQNDSGILKGSLTDVNGYYIIKDIVPGEYRIIASYMGYNEKEILADIEVKNVKHNFLLSQKSFSLSELEITAEKNLVERNIEKTTINVAKNTTLTGGTAIDVMQTLPSVDVDIDGNISYRGSDKLIILLNGEKSELVKSLGQIPADQIEKIELINNPSAKYQADGMSGIINIVLKSGNTGKNKASMMLNGGYPETLGGNAGYSRMLGKTRVFVTAGLNHKTKNQTKEHLRKNYENPDALNFYQIDRQDETLNNAFVNSNLEYSINKDQHIAFSVIGSKKFNSADREIKYETQNRTGDVEAESLKEIDIALDNYTFDGNVNYRCNFSNSGQSLIANFHFSLLEQLQQMNHEFYAEMLDDNADLQNSISKQLNKKADFSLDYLHPVSDSILFETGYDFSTKDLLNNFTSESYSYQVTEWIEDAALVNKFNYVQQIHATYLNINAKLRFSEIQAGVRAEYTYNSQNNKNEHEYIDFFPSVNISKKLNNRFSVSAGYNRRINRPTIKMLNPFTDEYADILNMHKGNPDLKPEYVNSFEVGSQFIFDKISGSGSVYYRDIDQAISRIKSASNDSALIVSFMNLDEAKLLGSEAAITYKPFKWWTISTGGNIFHTNLRGVFENNQINNNRLGWNLSVSNRIKLPNDFGFQISGYYRSKLPSVAGIYKERYYMDLAVNRKILKNKGQLVFRISDFLNMYEFGLELDALDENHYRYSQINRRKNESRYFILSFVYNINGKEQKKNQNDNFFLDGFDK